MKQTREYPLFTVSKKGTRWVEGGHPWIYAEEILSMSAEPENGALADAVSEGGKYLGTGLYSRESKIGLRLLSHNANDRFDDGASNTPGTTARPCWTRRTSPAAA